jgi:CoA:oxalate CoA-transferase
MAAIGRPEWVSDARFCTYTVRRHNWAELMDVVEDWSRLITTEQCLAALSREGVPASAYRTVAEALRDPQLQHREALSEVNDGGGAFRVLNLPFRMSGADTKAGSRIASLGEHTAEVLEKSVLTPGKTAV